MKITLDWQKRAIILFAASVLIFSVIMTFFAIREAERDKLQNLKEISQEQKEIADAINDQVMATIRETEKQALNLFLGANDAGSGVHWDEVAGKIKEGENLIELIFYVDQDEQIRFPLSKLLYVFEKESESLNKVLLEIESNQLFKSAETAEYQHRNYSRAINNYTQLMRSTSQKASQALLLNRIARCYRATGNATRAIQTYQRIVSDFNEVVSPEGIPYALVAKHQMGVSYSGLGEVLASINTFINLYKDLMEGRWSINKTQFFYYIGKVKAELDSLKKETEVDNIEENIDTHRAELERIEKEKLQEMDTVEAIAQIMLSVLQTKEAVTEGSSETFFHVSNKSEDKLLLISYTYPENSSIFGFSLNPLKLEENVLSSVHELDSLGEDFFAQIADDEKNRMIAGDASWTDDQRYQLGHSQGFEEDFLPWKIRIYQSLPNQAERQFRLRRNIYILLVLVVITAILLGGILAIRSTGKELRLAKLKSEFVSTVSHEFRTPLTSIRYLADLLQRGRVKEESKKQQYYESITHESERLSRLVENILDFSKIEAGMKEYEFDDTDAAEICREVVSRFQEQITPLEFKIESDIPQDLPKMSLDKEALSRALFNLLDNAVKYSGNSRKINFQVWSDPNKLYLTVEDQGIGIAEEDQNRVFNKFYRSGDIQNSSIKGSGIGLTIVSHIVKAHSGEVILTSNMGEGTKVTIRLPLKATNV